jgi:7-cyano-7-deazaguanine synthase
MESSALVVLSGGADSTICAAIAQTHFTNVHAISFNYGQRHLIELESAASVASELKISSHEVVDLRGLLVGDSPLVSSHKAVDRYSEKDEISDRIASTFVPMRNQLFLTIAANRANAYGCDVLYTGVCETDYSGYPDCRRAFIDNLEDTIALSLTGELGRFVIHTPLMYETKANSILIAKKILQDRFESVMEKTHTCYNGIRGGCGECAACLLRDRGFTEAGIDDPIWKYRG